MSDLLGEQIWSEQFGENAKIGQQIRIRLPKDYVSRIHPDVFLYKKETLRERIQDFYRYHLRGAWLVLIGRASFEEYDT